MGAAETAETAVREERETENDRTQDPPREADAEGEGEGEDGDGDGDGGLSDDGACETPALSRATDNDKRGRHASREWRNHTPIIVYINV